MRLCAGGRSDQFQGILPFRQFRRNPILALSGRWERPTRAGRRAYKSRAERGQSGGKKKATMSHHALAGESAEHAEKTSTVLNNTVSNFSIRNGVQQTKSLNLNWRASESFR